MAITISGTDGISPLKASGQTQTTTGTAASPAISSSSDTDSGIFFGTNEVNISTDGTQRATVDSSGKVGIGVTSPASLLEVHSDTASQEVARFEGDYTSSGDVTLASFRRGGGAVAAAVQYHDALTSMSFGSTTNHAFAFRSNNTERMRVNSYGKILCGAVSPVTFTTTNGLEVHSSNNGGALVVRNTSATAGQFWRIGPETNNTLVIYSSNATGVFLTHTGSSWSPNTSDLRIKDVVGTFNQATSWNVLKGLQIKEWWFKNESTEHREANTPHVGPIAQELHALDPNLRLESPGGTTAENFGQDFDGPVYTYDNDLLLKHALSALNQAIAKIETLETKVAALEVAS